MTMNNQKIFQIPAIAEKKGTIKSVVQACSDENLGDKTKKFVVPEALHDLTDGDHVLPYYCSEELCNVEAPIEAVIKDKESMTAFLKENPKGTAGAAQTTVAVATIAFSMVMARLAL